MSLNYNFANADQDAIAQVDPDHQNLFAFCVMMMATGISKITTEEEVQEFVYRARIFHSANSAPFSYESDIKFYRAMAEAYKGITTNVSPESLHGFLTKKIKRAVETNVRNAARVTA